MSKLMFKPKVFVSGVNVTKMAMDRIAAKQANVCKAIMRVDTLQQKYFVAKKPFPYNFDPNLMYETRARLEAKAWDLWSQWHDLHWDLHGFNAY